MKVKIYKKPNGQCRELEIKNVFPEDDEYFTKNNIPVSMEEIDSQYVVYGEVRVDECGEPIELIVLSLGRSCEETLKELREECESFFKTTA